MNNLVRVRAVTPEITVGNINGNKASVLKLLSAAEHDGCDLAVFPELCVTAYTCSDMFLQPLFIQKAAEAVLEIAEATKNSTCVAAVGFPFLFSGKLYNCAAVMAGGKILGIVPKRKIPNYNEFYELRHFTPYISGEIISVPFGDTLIPFGSIVFDFGGNFIFGAEICEDLWTGSSPSDSLCSLGATVIANLSASNEIIGKAAYRRTIITARSGFNSCAYIYANAGKGESTTDLVFSGHKLIAENGNLTAESAPFSETDITYDIDVDFLIRERQKLNTFESDSFSEARYIHNPLQRNKKSDIIRTFNPYPFVPSDNEKRRERCQEILSIQTEGLKKRITHIGTPKAIIGISGGLDSTLALIVTVRAFESLGRDKKDIVCITMPCFGTTDRTRNNAVDLCGILGVTLREIPIDTAVLQHFSDISHDKSVCNIAYENSQARERTQVLMDIANDIGGIVVGTGDLSELALGWATYNGDHMSMYAVNSSIPKTLVRYLVSYYSDSRGGKTKEVLDDILLTPVSPELLPPKDGEISQRTEDLVGPYELHDFFLYYFLRCGYPPKKILQAAVIAFDGEYDRAVILKWLKVFFRRFFAQQYKRSCMPDGPKVGSVALSPRGDLRFPSDASGELWFRELD